MTREECREDPNCVEKRLEVRLRSGEPLNRGEKGVLSVTEVQFDSSAQRSSRASEQQQTTPCMLACLMQGAMSLSDGQEKQSNWGDLDCISSLEGGIAHSHSLEQESSDGRRCLERSYSQPQSWLRSERQTNCYEGVMGVVNVVSRCAEGCHGLERR